MKKSIEEFKKFALKGNVIDLAVGVIIGGAFGKIVTSLVNDVVSPILGLVTGKIDLSDLKFKLAASTPKAPDLAIRYGAFLQTIIDFMIVAVSVFLLIKIFNRIKKKEAEKSAVPSQLSKEEQLLTDIRDLLKEMNRSS